jgi:hypothetical protein
MASATGTAIKDAFGFDAVPDDPASAVVAGRRQHVDGAFETVECMGAAGSDHLK